MKRNPIDVDKILRSFPSASNERVESARARILKRVHAGAAVGFDRVDHEREVAIGNGRDSRRVKWSRFAVPVSAVAMILAAIAIGMILVPSGPYAVVEASDSGLYRLSGAQAIRINPGERIEAKDVVRAGGGSAVIRLADGSLVEMRSETELSLDRADDGTQVRLQKGDIIVNAARQGRGHLYVQTKDVTVSVVGTVFLVNAEAGGSRVAVIEGEVRVQHDGKEQRLQRGEQAATTTVMPPQFVQEEIAWSRNAEAHVALLEQREVSSASMQGGTISGVVSTSSGGPASGFRVAALRADTVSSIRAMLSIAETDSTGLYTLQNVPAGRYYVVVGRIDAPTYYPGTLDVDKALAVTIASGTHVSAADFVIQDASAAALPRPHLSFKPALPVAGPSGEPLKLPKEVIESLMKQLGQAPTENQFPNQNDEFVRRMLDEIRKSYGTQPTGGTPPQGTPPEAPKDK
jgi:hypothetical protein